MTPVTEHHSGSTCAHSAKWCANIDLPRVEECVCTKFRLNSAQFSFCSSENLDLIAKLAWQNEIKLSPMSAKLQRLNRSLAKCVRRAAKPGSFTPAVCSVQCAAHMCCTPAVCFTPAGDLSPSTRLCINIKMAQATEQGSTALNINLFILSML